MSSRNNFSASSSLASILVFFACAFAGEEAGTIVAQGPVPPAEAAPVSEGDLAPPEDAGVLPDADALEAAPERPPYFRSYEDLERALPRDSAGNLDWVAAVRMGSIEPQPGIDPAAEDVPTMPLDVVLDSGLLGWKTTFSHETHTYWLGCGSCHRSGVPMQSGIRHVDMELIFAGGSCGRCHGKVAFANETGCERCHSQLRIGWRPANEPSAPLGDLVMDRHSSENHQPPVVFPHWKHRAHFRCYACHPKPFKMSSGANEITMDALLAGESCGRCHNGYTAFAAEFGTCGACHPQGAPPVQDVPSLAGSAISPTLPPEQDAPVVRVENHTQSP